LNRPLYAAGRAGISQHPIPQLAFAGAVTRLTLTNFRTFPDLRLGADARCAVLTGPNGAGKTNLLEALSFLAPGRGLRSARLPEVTRHGAAGGWSVAATLATAAGAVEVATGLAGAAAAERRVVKIDTHPARGQAALAEIVAVIWLTPRMDRLFGDAAQERRRFLDRLVFAFDPGHAQ
jgi:DNA replication and repair protein RecF